MAYTKTTWADRSVQYPNRFTRTSDGTYDTLTPSPGTITSTGTPITATGLNNIEDGIKALHDLTKVGVVAELATNPQTLSPNTWTRILFTQKINIGNVLKSDSTFILPQGTYLISLSLFAEVQPNTDYRCELWKVNDTLVSPSLITSAFPVYGSYALSGENLIDVPVDGGTYELVVRQMSSNTTSIYSAKANVFRVGGI